MGARGWEYWGSGVPEDGETGASWCHGIGYQDMGISGDQNSRGWGCSGTQVPGKVDAEKCGSRV